MDNRNLNNTNVTGNGNPAMAQRPVKYITVHYNVSLPNGFNKNDLVKAFSYIDMSNELTKEDKAQIKNMLLAVDSIEKRPEQEQRNIKTCLAQSWVYFRGYAPKLLARLSEVPSIAAYMSQLISQ